MVAILDFSILSKLLKGDSSTTRLDIIMGMPDMNNQKRKKLYQTKQGWGKYVGLCLAARLPIKSEL